MKPWQLIDRALAGNSELTLVRRDNEWAIRCDGKPLMSTRQHGSEEALARLAFDNFTPGVNPKRVLIGGLGLGFTARAALDLLSIDSTLVIAELSESIVAWNKIHLGEFAKHPLDDPRVKLHQGDAVAHIYKSINKYDALLLDIDNGPSAMVQATNDRLYSSQGIAACVNALKPKGVLAVWSAAPDAAYLKRLNAGGFRSLVSSSLGARWEQRREARDLRRCSLRDLSQPADVQAAVEMS